MYNLYLTLAGEGEEIEEEKKNNSKNKNKKKTKKNKKWKMRMQPWHYWKNDLKKFRLWTRFEPTTFALPVQCSTIDVLLNTNVK